MHYGKASAKIFAVLAVTVSLQILLHPTWGSLLSTFVKSSILLCPPLALGFSVAGVLRDDRKQYAAVMLLVSGVFTLWLAWALFARWYEAIAEKPASSPAATALE